MSRHVGPVEGLGSKGNSIICSSNGTADRVATYRFYQYVEGVLQLLLYITGLGLALNSTVSSSFRFFVGCEISAVTSLLVLLA